MSIEHGMAALRLEMSDRVPRTEYSVQNHWELLSRVTGRQVDAHSPAALQQSVQREFFHDWNFDLQWSVLIQHNFLGDYYTDMGHAAYEADGSDYRPAGKPVFDDPEQALAFDPLEKLPHYEQRELVRRFDEDYDHLCAYSPEAVNMTGTYITCMSGLIDMMGWDTLLLAAGTDQEAFGRLTERYAAWMQPFFDAVALCKAPVIMAHDDIVWTSGPFLHPEWYRRFIFPAYKKLFAPVLESGKKLLFTSDGTYTDFIDDIAATGVNGFVLEPTTDMAYIAEKYGRMHAFVGNADTRILLYGTKDEIRAEVKRCMDIGKSCPGFFMAVGNHIPANTPVDNALWYEECYEEMARR